jgi:hypothetical protein
MGFIQSFLAGIPFLPGDKEVLADEFRLLSASSRS